DGLGKRRGQTTPAVALALEHVVGHPLRGLLAHAGQHAAGFDQLFEERGHGAGGRRTLGVVRGRQGRGPDIGRQLRLRTAEDTPVNRRRDQNGSFIPGGIGIPAVALAILSLDAASILLDASLNAAATRSSVISGSESTLGSMRTLRHSLVPESVTLTTPPPALPVTSSAAISSCTRCMFSCIFCACCISWAMFPRMGLS